MRATDTGLQFILCIYAMGLHSVFILFRSKKTVGKNIRFRLQGDKEKGMKIFELKCEIAFTVVLSSF